MDQAPIGHLVDLRHRNSIFCCRDFGITLVQSTDDLFDRCAHARFERDIVLAAALRLLRTFCCGFDIGHSRDPYGRCPVLIFTAPGGERRVFSVFAPGLSIVGRPIGV
jgi:hypothetical protein